MNDGVDIYGTSVNIAARLKALADPSGILISEHTHQQIHDKLEFDLRDRGPKNLKNIDEPVRAYAVYLGSADSILSDAPKTKNPPHWRAVAAGLVIAGLVGALGWQSDRGPRVEAAVVEDMAFPLPDKPSIAVLAFENLSTSDDELLADSFSEDILIFLSKLTGLFVISRTTSFTYKGKNASVKQIAEDLGIRFVLEGSIQRDGDRIRVTAQLIDAAGGQHVWADRYDRKLTDLFAVKDEITLNIVSSISAETGVRAINTMTRRETESLEAWLHWRQARDKFVLLTVEANAVSREHLQQALAIDPNFLSAIVALGNTYRSEGFFRWVDDPKMAI